MHLGRGVTLPLSDVTIRTSRSSGPGGQHANVTASRVEAILDVDASSLDPAVKRRITARYGPRVTATAQDSRSQSRNRQLALDRLERRLRGALVARRPRVATSPTRASVRRRLSDKQRHAQRKRERRRPTGEDS